VGNLAFAVVSVAEVNPSSTQCIETWMDIRAGLDVMEKRKKYVQAGIPTQIYQRNS
jgi:hypothetical protein